MNLQNKVSIVTGVSRGIGKAVVLALLEKGAKVAGWGQRDPQLNDPDFMFIKTDIRSPEQVQAAFQQVQTTWGGDVHILINNAGLGYFGLLEEMPMEQWHEMMDTNVNGLYYCTRNVLPQMKQQEYGHIINIASTAALDSMPQVSAYASTKWAVRGLSQALYRELRDYKIKVTCVYPGSTQTDFFKNSPGIQPHEYMLQPEDIASNIIHTLESPDNYHNVNIEIRPLQPKGPRKKG